MLDNWTLYLQKLLAFQYNLYLIMGNIDISEEAKQFL